MSQQITIGHIKQGNKRSMSKPLGNYMWGNVDDTIQIIDSRIDLLNRTTDLYDPKFFSTDNDICSQQSYHNIGEFVLMKKQNCIQSGFKSQCTSINERISRLEVYLHSRKNKSKTFPPLQSEFLPPFKNITLKRINKFLTFSFQIIQHGIAIDFEYQFSKKNIEI